MQVTQLKSGSSFVYSNDLMSRLLQRHCHRLLLKVLLPVLSLCRSVAASDFIYMEGK